MIAGRIRAPAQVKIGEHLVYYKEKNISPPNQPDLEFLEYIFV